MKDQPKPASGEHSTAARETFQDIAPATGEWTADTVARLFDERVFRSDYPLYEETYKRISDAHNAALADERELADRNANVIEATALELGYAREQLAAAEERWEQCAMFLHEQERVSDQLREQLAAAVEALNLTRQCAESGSLFDTIDAALAKIPNPTTTGHWEGNQWCPHADNPTTSGEWTAKTVLERGTYR